MSINTPAGESARTSAVSTDKKKSAAGGKAASNKQTSDGKGKAGKAAPGGKSAADGKRGGTRPGGAAGRGRNKPIKPVKVSQGRAWGPIAMFVAVGVVAAGIIGWAAVAAYKGAQPWEKRAAAIDGIINYRESDPELVDTRGHKPGSLTYSVHPPVAGDHNDYWQRCMGDVYDAPIANEHAVHSLEHGAVWVTYRTGLSQDQVEKLADRVRGTDYMLMSPVDDLDAPISLQAWGYQLKVENADDGRIDEFIKALRVNANVEPGATCSGGITATGTTPRDLAGGMKRDG